MYIIIAGIGVLGEQLTKILVAHKHDVVCIDIDKEVCEALHEEAGTIVINGNATDLGILKEAGADKADILVCLMRSDSDNMAAALLGKSLGIPRVIVALRKPIYENAYKSAGVDVIVKIPDLLLNQLINEIEQPTVRKVANVGKEKAGVYTIKIPEKSKVIGKSIKEITNNKKFPEECVFIGIYKEEKDEFLIPRGNNVFHQNDTVFLVSKDKDIKKVVNMLTKT